MELRYDRATVTTIRKDGRGYYRFPAYYARDGVLVYTQPDGSKVRELRPPEENEKLYNKLKVEDFPVTLEHPPVLVSADNADEYTMGISPSDRTFYKTPYLGGEPVVFASKAKQAIDNGVREISMGYLCRIEHSGGVWQDSQGNAHPYDRIQRDITPNHIALTRKGRAGAEVGIRTDSSDRATELHPLHLEQEFPELKLDSSNTDDFIGSDMGNNGAYSYTADGFSMPLSPEAAQGQLISRLDTLKKTNEELETKVDSLEFDKQNLDSELSEARSQVEATTAQRDAYAEELVEVRDSLQAAESILAANGFEYDATTGEWSYEGEPAYYDSEYEDDDLPYYDAEDEDEDEEEEYEEEEDEDEDEMPKRDSLDEKFMVIDTINSLDPTYEDKLRMDNKSFADFNNEQLKALAITLSKGPGFAEEIKRQDSDAIADLYERYILSPMQQSQFRQDTEQPPDFDYLVQLAGATMSSRLPRQDTQQANPDAQYLQTLQTRHNEEW